ncbi:ribonucleoside hydrolase RihC [[Acholeplasma] multilocale]|uniref:ribonucleoside hydrolase RihC n=1 Tax=[Acholeplasma] multilocale TaxID=264638 RepID=UPI000479F6BC|nr:ribonucleoside hydrolase RihC [[Acholeplasma] multilocale]
MRKTPIIIDTDPGIDDAAAICIALFNESVDVRLITTVAGNVGIDKTTANAVKLLEITGKDVPVAAGAQLPLIRPLRDAANVHGSSGMDGYEFPEPDMSRVLEEHAVVAMRNELMRSEEKITIMPIGPLTNIGLLLRMYPEVKTKIERIVLMGGAFGRGNMGVYSEFNINIDPEAAKIVFESGLDIVMAPMEVGIQAKVTPEMKEEIKDGKIGDMFVKMFSNYGSVKGNPNSNMYDGCAIGYITNPDMFVGQKTYVEVDTQNSISAGTTYCDFRNFLGKEPNVFVLKEVKHDLFSKWFVESIKKCG